MSKKIVALPVDGRPVVREQVRQLVGIAGWQLVMPDVAALGHFRQPADGDYLNDWLQTFAADADGFVLSLDMLVYGGLVPSRFIADSKDALLTRLSTLILLKQRYPHRPIYCFIATMRLSNNNINEEEKDYWNLYGELIWRWSFYQDRYAALGDASDATIANDTMNSIPDVIRVDYLATRKRNFSIAMHTLSLVKSGVIDRLILPQDDTAGYGFNIAERRQLQQAVAAECLESRVQIYPGADEVIHTLSARMVSVLECKPATKFFIIVTDEQHIATLNARYEDRPVLESIAAQMTAVGGVSVSEAAAADVLLLVHSAGAAQGDWAMRLPLSSTSTVTADSLKKALNVSNKKIAVLDIAYANGGDPVLIDALSQFMPLNTLTAYAGWNTASNSAGSLLAQCVLAAHDADARANQHALCLRLLEDYLYQAVIRQQIRNEIDEAAMSAAALTEKVSAVFIPAANDWLRHHQFDWRVASIYLPWNRTFEIGINLVPTVDGN
jgi:Protein of unknown function (DUF4127)